MSDGDPKAAFNPASADQAAVKLIAGDRPLKYVNFFRVLNQAEEIVFDFALHSEPWPLELVSTNRIAMNPYFVRKLYDALADQVTRYEKVFGPIEIEIASRMKDEPSAAL